MAIDYAIVLCGGIGSRLWPISSEVTPKQFQRLYNGKTLLENTVCRLPDNINVLFVSNIIYKNDIDKIYKNKYERILEPLQKNTAPAILISILHILNKHKHMNPKNIRILVVPSDHFFENEKFSRALENAFNLANKGNLITFGISPNYPETGYGYIEKDLNGNNIKRFIEKPPLNDVLNFLKSDNYLWNSGVFVFNLKTIINEYKKNQPELFEYCKTCYLKSKIVGNTINIDNSYEKCQDISFDYAIMEKTKLGKVIKFDGLWSDIGDWNRLYNFLEKDHDQNVSIGNVITKNTKNSFVFADRGIVVANGLSNIVIVKSGNNIYLSDKKSSSNIKEILHDIKNRDNYRPWGFYHCIGGGINEGYQVKKITIYPKQRLSLQYHFKRSEHWTIIRGIAKVELDEKVYTLKKNDSIYIPVESRHRITNIGTENVEFIETQVGDYLGEDDIVRLEDDYGRI